MEDRKEQDSVRKELVSKDADPLLQRRAVLTFLFQLIPWGTFALIAVVIAILEASYKGDISDTFVYICGICFIMVVVTSIAGMLMACKNSGGDNASIVLMVIEDLVLTTFGLSVSYILESGIHAIYVFAIALPLLVLTLSHFLWALIRKSNPLNIAFSNFVILLSAVTAAVCWMINGGSNTQWGSGATLFAFLHIFLSASWISAAKETITLE